MGAQWEALGEQVRQDVAYRINDFRQAAGGFRKPRPQKNDERKKAALAKVP